MTKDEFLNIISNGLSEFPSSKRSEILYDYEEHFSIGLSQGKTEQEIISELGDPHTIIRSYMDNYSSRFNKAGSYNDNNYSNNNKKSSGFWVLTIVIILLLSPLLLGLSCGLLGIIIAFFAVCFVVFVLGIGFIASGVLGFNEIISHFSNIDINLPGSAQILLGVGNLCLSILLIIGTFFILKGVIFLIKQLINFFK